MEPPALTRNTEDQSNGGKAVRQNRCGWADGSTQQHTMATTASWQHNTGLPLISSSLRNRRRRPAEIDAPPPPPVPDLIVTGTVTPDCTGNYYQIADHYGAPAYEREDQAWHIWATDVGVWVHFISIVIGDAAPYSWFRQDTDPAAAGNFFWYVGTTGTATAAPP